MKDTVWSLSASELSENGLWEHQQIDPSLLACFLVQRVAIRAAGIPTILLNDPAETLPNP